MSRRDVVESCSFEKKPRYAVEGSVGAAGSVVSWLRDGLGVLSGRNAIFVGLLLLILFS